MTTRGHVAKSMRETIEGLRAEVTQAEGVARGYMLAAEKAEAALRHWQTRESAMNCDACACLGLAIPDELRDTAPEVKP